MCTNHLFIHTQWKIAYFWNSQDSGMVKFPSQFVFILKSSISEKWTGQWIRSGLLQFCTESRTLFGIWKKRHPAVTSGPVLGGSGQRSRVCAGGKSGYAGCTAAPARARAWHAAAALLRPPAARARAASAQAQRGRRRTPPGSGRQGPGSRGSARFCARCVQEQAPPLQTDCWNQLRQRPAAKHGAESDLSAYVMPQKYLTENLPFQLHLFLRY